MYYKIHDVTLCAKQTKYKSLHISARNLLACFLRLGATLMGLQSPAAAEGLRAGTY